jgi:hypothetical protein
MACSQVIDYLAETILAIKRPPALSCCSTACSCCGRSYAIIGSLTIFVDVSFEEAMARAVRRDVRLAGASEERVHGDTGDVTSLASGSTCEAAGRENRPIW